MSLKSLKQSLRDPHCAHILEESSGVRVQGAGLRAHVRVEVFLNRREGQTLRNHAHVQLWKPAVAFRVEGFNV